MHWGMSTPAALEAVRRHAPLVSCITNAVVTNITANVLLALGAAPAMVDITGEAGPFARVASTLLINLGTPQPEQRDAAREAVAAAADAGTPWVLDPVAIGTLTHRTALARELFGRGPSVVRAMPRRSWLWPVTAAVGGASRPPTTSPRHSIRPAIWPAATAALSPSPGPSIWSPTARASSTFRAARLRATDPDDRRGLRSGCGGRGLSRGGAEGGPG